MIRISYDDRERFPWLVWAGDYLWSKCRTRKCAVWIKGRLEKATEAAQLVEATNREEE